MGKCAHCGNDYDQSFTVTMGGRTMIFDLVRMRDRRDGTVCPRCGVRIVGHGVQHVTTIFCCVHCAKHEGISGLRDRD
jgi:DNA-directed RNA polymerase subunit RPC12/RpoP